MTAAREVELKTIEDVTQELTYDTCVKVAGIDVDGIPRGKVMAKSKFLSIIESGFGFCSVIFGWDMHDSVYPKELSISNKENGYKDIVAKIDIGSFRRIPWENNVPFFLVYFLDPDTDKALCACPRSLLDMVCKRAGKLVNANTLSGFELEFYHYRETAASLEEKKGHNLIPLTPGQFGYSLLRPALNKDYYYKIWDTSLAFKTDLEGWHTETGPGVYEAALKCCNAREMADRGILFKLLSRSIGSTFGIVPCFMAKPHSNLPGNSGHIHVSLIDKDSGENLFARNERDVDAKWKDIEYLSDTGRQFLAGVLLGLSDIMPLLAPTINSYKRLVESFWAPVTISWGLEHRIASIRLISPPTCSKKATRLEIRTPGADVNPYFAMSGIFALGLYGIENKLEIKIPPMGKDPTSENFNRLPKSLREAVDFFTRPDSLARKTLGNEFVDHYAQTRLNEVNKFDDAVTDWEISRYMETV